MKDTETLARKIIWSIAKNTDLPFEKIDIILADALKTVTTHTPDQTLANTPTAKPVWDDATAEEYAKTLTNPQKVYLKHLLANGGSATTASVYSELTAKLAKAKPGLSLAGIRACLTRKCQSTSLSNVDFFNANNNSYTINPEAQTYLAKHI